MMINKWHGVLKDYLLMSRYYNKIQSGFKNIIIYQDVNVFLKM